MRIFLAGAGSMRDRCHEVISWLQGLGHEVHDWTQDPGWGDVPSLTIAEQCAAADLKAVQECDGFIWMLDQCHPSHGAPFEAGVASALGKPIVVLAEQPLSHAWIYWHMFHIVAHKVAALDLLERAWAREGTAAR